MLKPKQPYSHLRVHSEYSLVDSTIEIRPLLKLCRERGIPSIALTDMCNMFGSIKFYQACLIYGIKPIFGTDLLIENNGRVYNICFLAKNKQGYNNIVKLVSKAYINLPRSRGIPLIPKSWIYDCELDHIFVLTGGIKGELGIAIMQSDDAKIKNIINEYTNIFKKNNFFIELQKIGDERETSYIEKACSVAKTFNIPIVSTNNVCFLNQNLSYTTFFHVDSIKSFLLRFLQVLF